MSESVLAALGNALYTPAVPAASHCQQRLCFSKSEPRGQDTCMRTWLPTQKDNAVTLCHTVVFHLELSVSNWNPFPWSLLGAAVALLLAAREALILGLHSLLWKVSAPSTKGLIWRSSLMKEKDEVCIHVPSQWEMFGLGDMNMYRKIKARGVLFCCFPWWLDSVMNVPW